MKKIATLAVALALSACASTGPTSSAGGDEFDTLIKQAEEAANKADANGGAWRDTGKFIKDAKDAKAAGDMEKAMKLAKKAKFEGDQGAKQAMEQAKAGPWLF